jgi:hypothetical protein
MENGVIMFLPNQYVKIIPDKISCCFWKYALFTGYSRQNGKPQLQLPDGRSFEADDTCMGHLTPEEASQWMFEFQCIDYIYDNVGEKIHTNDYIKYVNRSSGKQSFGIVTSFDFPTLFIKDLIHKENTYSEFEKYVYIYSQEYVGKSCEEDYVQWMMEQ